MDPQACLERAYAAFAEGDFAELHRACMDLAVWINRGGDAPVSLGGTDPRKVWAKLMTVAGAVLRLWPSCGSCDEIYQGDPDDGDPLCPECASEQDDWSDPAGGDFCDSDIE